MIGSTLGRYKIMEELGQGGMSVVYRGVDVELEREVAIKMLHSHLARKDENRLRFRREARAIARLEHANILKVYDFSSTEDEDAFIVMEYVAGETLRQHVERHGSPPPELCALLAVSICDALAHAHAHGIIHRDIKPENVMVTREGVVKLMDFGIAHIFDAETMTQTGSLMGSPAHMAPEMIEGERVDERADVFALGTVLYWLATGRMAFEGKNAPQILRRVLEGLYKNPEAHDPRVGQRFGDIIRRCMAFEPQDRYASAGEVRDALLAFAAGMGSADLDAEVTVYLADPAAYRARFDAEIVARLLEQARRATEQGRPNEAFRLLNRVLGYDPHNTCVRDQLAALQRRELPWTLLVAGAAAALLAAGGAWVWASHAEQRAAAEAARQAREAARLTAARLDVRRHTSSLDPGPALIAALATSSASAETARQLASAEGARLAAAPLSQHLRERAIAHAAGLRAAADTSTPPVNTLANLTFRRARPPVRRVVAAAIDPAEGADMGTTTAPVEPPVKPPEAPRSVYRFKLPAAAKLSIDGGPPMSALKVVQGVELEHGSHHLAVQCPDRQTYTRTERFDEARARTPLDIFPSWKPATIHIATTTQSTIHVLDPPFRSNLSDVMAVTRGKGALKYEAPFPDARQLAPRARTVTIKICDRANMLRCQDRTFRVMPGEDHSFTASFPSSPSPP